MNVRTYLKVNWAFFVLLKHDLWALNCIQLWCIVLYNYAKNIDKNSCCVSIPIFPGIFKKDELESR